MASLFRSRRVTDLTCCDLRELTLTPTLPTYITGALPQPPPLWPAISTYLPARPPLAAAAASSSCCAITRIQRVPPSLLPRAVVSPASQSVRAACRLPAYKVTGRISAVAECGMCPKDTSHGATRTSDRRSLAGVRHLPLGRGSAKRWKVKGYKLEIIVLDGK